MAESVTQRVDNPSESGVDYYVGLEHLDPDSLTIRRWGTPKDVTATKLRFEPGDIIFGRRRAYQRKVAVAEFEGICSAHALVLRPCEKTVDKGFLPFFMQSDVFLDRALSISVGSLSPTINWRTLAVQKFAVPSKTEQRRISALMTAAKAVTDATGRLALAVDKVQSSAIENCLLKAARDDAGCDVQLRDICDIETGQINPTSEDFKHAIHIAPDDIEAATGRILEQRTAEDDGVVSGKYRFSSRAVLYSKIRPELKKVALPDFGGICSADVYPLYPREGVEREFLFAILMSDSYSRYAIARSARTAIPKINRREMLHFGFRLPPADIQRHIASIIRSTDVVRADIRAKSSRERNLHRALAKKLMSPAEVG